MNEKPTKKDLSLSDYCLIDKDDQQSLSNFERLTLIGGAELEKAIAWFAKQLTRFSYLEQFGKLDVVALKRAVDFYDQQKWRDEPETFYEKPKYAPLVIEKEIHGLPDGSIIDLSFPSSYQPNIELKEYYESFSENCMVHARYWQHHQPNLPTIIAVHGWTMGDQRVNSLAFQPGYLYRLGMNVLLFELPFHGRRQPSSGLSSAIFPSTDFFMTNSAIAQAISDLREMKMYLNSKPIGDIGLMGMSLGGYVVSLWHAIEACSFCIPIVPLVSMTDLAWKIVLSSSHADLYLNQGLTRELFEAVYYLHSPTFFPPVNKDQVLIVAGLSDQVVPPEQAKMLWEHWEHPEIYWFDGGHMATADKSRVFPEIACFFRKLGLIANIA